MIQGRYAGAWDLGGGSTGGEMRRGGENLVSFSFADGLRARASELQPTGHM